MLSSKRVFIAVEKRMVISVPLYFSSQKTRESAKKARAKHGSGGACAGGGGGSLAALSPRSEIGENTQK